MRVLVTGGTGFIGRHLIPKLSEAGHDVDIIALPASHHSVQVAPPQFDDGFQITIHRADLRNYNLTMRAIRDAEPDRIIHLAAAGVTNPFLKPEQAIRHNLYGTLNLLRACFESNQIVKQTQQVIIARTPGERCSLNVYAASKAAAWSFCQMYARTSGWPIIGAMIFQAYGPGQPDHTLVKAAIKAAKAGEAFPMTSGRQQRDWIYVDDVVDGIIATLHADLDPGKTIELGTGKATSVADVVQRIFELIGSNGKPMLGRLPDRPGEPEIQLADVLQTRECIGWQFQVPLDAGLRLTINHE